MSQLKSQVKKLIEITRSSLSFQNYFSQIWQNHISPEFDYLDMKIQVKSGHLNDQILKMSKQQQISQQNISQLKRLITKWLINMLQTITSHSFRKYNQNKFSESDLKVYCSKNIILNFNNLMQSLKKSKLNLKQMSQFIDRQSKLIVKEIAFKYHITIPQQSYSHLKRIIFHPNTKYVDNYDLIKNIKEGEQKDYNRVMMNIINDTILLLNQSYTEGSFTTNYDLIKLFFTILFDYSGNNSFKILLGKIKDGCSIFQQLQKQQENNNKNSYKMKIQRTLPMDVKAFSKQQIQQNQITILNVSIQRFIKIWIDQLKKTLSNSTQIKKDQKDQLLNELESSKSKAMESLLKQKIYGGHYMNEEDVLIRNYAINAQRYMVNYNFIQLNKLISCFLKVQKNVEKVSLITFKSRVIATVRCLSDQNTIIQIYKQLLTITFNNPSILSIIKTQQRLQSIDNNVILQVIFLEKFRINIELQLQNNLSQTEEHLRIFNKFLNKIADNEFNIQTGCAQFMVQLDSITKMYIQRENQKNKKNEIQEVKLLQNEQNIKQIERLNQQQIPQFVRTDKNITNEFDNIVLFPYLKKLNVSNNKISNIWFITRSPALQSIILNKNSIQTLLPLINYENLNLKTFECAYQNIQIQMSSLFKLKNIRTLNLKNNKISSIMGLSDNLRHIQFLQIGYNNLSNLSGIQKLADLKQLNAEHNNIQIVKELINHDKLIQLNLAQNKITKFSSQQDFMNFSNLQKLNLNNNIINNLKQFGLFLNLRQLSLCQNKDKQLEKQLKWLEYLPLLQIKLNPELLQILKAKQKKFIGYLKQSQQQQQKKSQYLISISHEHCLCFNKQTKEAIISYDYNFHDFIDPQTNKVNFDKKQNRPKISRYNRMTINIIDDWCEVICENMFLTIKSSEAGQRLQFKRQRDGEKSKFKFLQIKKGQKYRRQYVAGSGQYLLVSTCGKIVSTKNSQFPYLSRLKTFNTQPFLWKITLVYDQTEIKI